MFCVDFCYGNNIIHYIKNIAAAMKQEGFTLGMNQLDDPAVLGNYELPNVIGAEKGI